MHVSQATSDFHSEAVELLEEGRSSAPLPLTRRELVAELLVGGLFVAAALALATFMPSERSFDPTETIVFVIAYAAATRIQFEVGAGYSPPTELLLVPMLFVLPTNLVPLVVGAGLLLGDLPDNLTGRRNGVRAVKVLGDSWHAVGPALVLGLAGAEAASWQDWPIYLAALGAQVACDLVASTAREWLGRAVAPRVQFGVLAWAYAVDVLLAPVGLLAAFATVGQSYAYLLLLPLAGLLVIFARERRARLDNAFALGRAYRETAELNARVLDTERKATRARQELIAGASHEMQTPLAVLLGLVDSVRNDPALPIEQRSQIYSAMRRQTILLRHLVRQFLDYTRVKTGRRLPFSPRAADVMPIIRDVVEAQSGPGSIEVEAEGDLPAALVDPDRLHQVLMCLVSNAVKFSPPGVAAVISARAEGESIEISVSDKGPGIEPDNIPRLFDDRPAEGETNGGPGAGLGLYLARTLTEPQGGQIMVSSHPGEGSCFTIVLPRASAAQGAPAASAGSTPDAARRT